MHIILTCKARNMGLGLDSGKKFPLNVNSKLKCVKFCPFCLINVNVTVLYARNRLMLKWIKMVRKSRFDYRKLQM